MTALKTFLDKFTVPPSVRRSTSRFMTEAEKRDWEAVDKWTRDVEAYLKTVHAAIQELQTVVKDL